MQVRHFLFTSDGAIQLISPAQAAAVASGEGSLPELAAQQAHYLQVVVDHPQDADSIQVRTAGARVDFDQQGHLRTADVEVDDEDGIDRFVHDTCVQLALDGVVESDIVVH